MTIQWFPGHMLETEKFLKESISNVDVVLEVLDARLPASSANPILNKICQNVLRIKILNKNDLADPEVTRQWLNHFKSRNETAMAINGTEATQTWRAAEMALADVQKGKARRVRMMVAGIPNSGKSTIINTLAGKKIAKTGNVPAITRHQQRTSLKNRADIYDTPGILWPVLENENGALRLAASGAISDTAIDYNEIALFALSFLMMRYPGRLMERYGITIEDGAGVESWTDQDASLPILEEIGKKRGCLKKGGIIDYQKASETLIRDLRSGKLGRITFETPEEAMTETSTHIQNT